MRYLVIWLVALAMNVQMFGVTQAAQSYQIPKEAKAAAQRYAKAYKAARDTIDLKYFDVDARAEDLNYDVNAAAEFVQTQIAFDPYLGVLRGPEGTLSTQAGNAWDQAVTLSALINSMGGEAMIVEGRLNETDATRLIAEHFAPRVEMPQTLDFDAVLEVMAPYLMEQTVAASKQRNQIAAQNANTSNDPMIEQSADKLLATLAQNGLDLTKTSPADGFIDQIAKDYVWVQYRDTPNDPWVQVHPAFGTSVAPEVTAARFIAGTVPDEKLHRLKVELFIERLEQGKASRISIMKAYDRPVANQAGKQITIGIGPNGPVEEEGGEAAFFVPLLNEDLAPGAQAFTLMGTTAPAEEAMAGPEIFATVSNRFGGALNSLAANKDGTPAVALGGVILIVTHSDPSGKTFVEERRLSDFRSSKTMSMQAKSTAVVFDGVIDVDVGEENQARDYYGFFGANGKRAKQLPMLMALELGKVTLEDFISSDAYDPEPNHTWGDMSLFGGIFAPRETTGVRVVRQGPLVTMRRLQRKADKTGIMQTVIDIMHHQAIGLAMEGGMPKLSPAAALRHGVRETVMEGVMIGKTSDKSWVGADVTEVITSNAQLQVYVTGQSITTGMEERLAADFERSNMLLISAAQDSLRWWRIDAATGETLGMSYHGGAELTEYAKTVTTIAGNLIAAAFFIWGAKSCEDTYGDNTKMRICCHAGNVALAAAGVGAGNKIGAHMAAHLKNAFAAGVGYFTAMMSWEITFDLAAGIGGGAMVDEFVCKPLLGE
jgi:hypothetical protein